jgi:hypothetical protein
VCRIAKIVKDEEIALLIAQSDSDLPSETDDSFELSLESDSSMLEQTPQVWRSSSRESDKSEPESTSDGEGSGVARSRRWQSYSGPNHFPMHPPPPVLYFCMVFTVQLLIEFVKQTNNYARNFLQAYTDLPPNSRARKWKNIIVAELKGFIAFDLNR